MSLITDSFSVFHLIYFLFYGREASEDSRYCVTSTASCNEIMGELLSDGPHSTAWANNPNLVCCLMERRRLSKSLLQSVLNH